MISWLRPRAVSVFPGIEAMSSVEITEGCRCGSDVTPPIVGYRVEPSLLVFMFLLFIGDE